MKQLAFLFTGMLTLSVMQAQYSIKIKITHLPATPVTDAVYLTGNFNNWNPKDEHFRLKRGAGGQYSIIVPGEKAASYEFKFTRGSWDSVETDSSGDNLPNRTFTISSDTSLQLSIAGWKDGFMKADQLSTASAQVKIIDTAFLMPQLNRSRRIWMYLPKDYATSGKKYPVLYMHDGQNLFDKATSFAGEWEVDEALDRLANACIVVGIDNGGIKRMTEYNPNNTKQFGKGEGKLYLSFIVHTLKPFIDKNYRTLSAKENTSMAGSSMGGLITFYAGLYYPEIFGTLGVFSPSFWIEPAIKTQVKQLAGKTAHGRQKYYFYVGEMEGGPMVQGMKAVAAELKKTVNPVTKILVNPAGKHNEIAWAAVFADFYNWNFLKEMDKE